MVKIPERLDFYDDAKGEVLKQRYPTPGSLPPIIKKGSFLSPAERERLPDNLFALVIPDGDQKLRKYACTDKTNTALSVMYFLDLGRKQLPQEIQKTAARNLLTACKWYDLEAPDILVKLAEDKPKNYIEPVVEFPTSKEPEQLKHADYCLPESEKYPIHTYRQVQAAVNYFEKHASKFEPSIRREYSKNLEKRANALGMQLPDVIKQYASTVPESRIHVDEQFAMRMRKTAGSHYERAYALLHKKAVDLPAEMLARALEEMDKQANLDIMWDEGIEDPWKTCFQLPKLAVYSFSDSTGYITEQDLSKLKEFKSVLKRAFSDDFVEGFDKNPVQTFDSLPLDQKRVIIQIAKQVSPVH